MAHPPRHQLHCTPLHDSDPAHKPHLFTMTDTEPNLNTLNENVKDSVANDSHDFPAFTAIQENHLETGSERLLAGSQNGFMVEVTQGDEDDFNSEEDNHISGLKVKDDIHRSDLLVSDSHQAEPLDEHNDACLEVTAQTNNLITAANQITFSESLDHNYGVLDLECESLYTDETQSLDNTNESASDRLENKKENTDFPEVSKESQPENVEPQCILEMKSEGTQSGSEIVIGSNGDDGEGAGVVEESVEVSQEGGTRVIDANSRADKEPALNGLSGPSPLDEDERLQTTQELCGPSDGTTPLKGAENTPLTGDMHSRVESPAHLENQGNQEDTSFYGECSMRCQEDVEANEARTDLDEHLCKPGVDTVDPTTTDSGLSSDTERVLGSSDEDDEEEEEEEDEWEEEDESEIMKLKNTISEMNRDLLAKSALVDRLQLELGDAYKESERSSTKLSQLQLELSASRERSNELDSELDIIRQRNHELELQITESEEEDDGLRDRIDKLEKELGVLRRENDRLASTLADREQHIILLKKGMEVTVQEAEAAKRKAEAELEAERRQTGEREESLLQDLEWKLREVEAASKRRVKEAELEAAHVNTKLSEATAKHITTEEQLLQAQTQLVQLKEKEAELAQLRTSSGELKRNLRTTTRRLEQLQVNEKVLQEETSRLRSAIDKEKSYAANLQIVHREELDERERKLNFKLQVQKDHLTSEWEKKTKEVVARAREEWVEEMRDEKARAALEATQRAQQELDRHKQSCQALQADYQLKVSELEKRLEEEELEHREELERAQTKSDLDVLELRRKMDKLYMGYEEKIDKLNESRESAISEEREKLQREKDEAIVESEKRWQEANAKLIEEKEELHSKVEELLLRLDKQQELIKLQASAQEIITPVKVVNSPTCNGGESTHHLGTDSNPTAQPKEDTQDSSKPVESCPSTQPSKTAPPRTEIPKPASPEPRCAARPSAAPNPPPREQFTSLQPPSRPECQPIQKPRTTPESRLPTRIIQSSQASPMSRRLEPYSDSSPIPSSASPSPTPKEVETKTSVVQSESEQPARQSREEEAEGSQGSQHDRLAPDSCPPEHQPTVNTRETVPKTQPTTKPVSRLGRTPVKVTDSARAGKTIQAKVASARQVIQATVASAKQATQATVATAKHAIQVVGSSKAQPANKPAQPTPSQPSSGPPQPPIRRNRKSRRRR